MASEPPAQITVFACDPTNILPTNPPRPCSSLLTDEESICYLRIDKTKTRDKKRALRRMVVKYGIRTAQVGKSAMYPLDELKRVIAAKCNEHGKGGGA